MKKFFTAILLALIISLPNICGAVEISREHYHDHAKVFYPKVHMSNAAVEKKINDKIKIEVLNYITGAQTYAMHNRLARPDLYSDYTIGANESGNSVILSIIFTGSYYIQGAPHPNTTTRTLNFNVQTGEFMDIGYLTEVGEGISKEEFLARIEPKLREHCARENIYLFDDALPLKKVPLEFYWDENLHVHIIYNHYEIAPYASGIIDVDIDG